MTNRTNMDTNSEGVIGFINQIISNNHRSLDGKLYISAILFSFLYETKKFDQFNKRVFDDSLFIEIESIPYDIRMEIGLFRTKSLEKSVGEEDVSQIFEWGERPTPEEYAKRDIEYALREEKKYRHEFIDYYSDINTVKRKARTLAIILNVSKGEKTEEYFRAVFKILFDWKPACELPLDNFKSFYKKYQFYLRIGIVQGLLNENFNPNI
jgi:hypothetical protein